MVISGARPAHADAGLSTSTPYRVGTWVVVVHGVPGLHPGVLDFARRLM